MSKLNASFDLHYDLKTVDQLKVFIDQFTDSSDVMSLMLDEIRSRDRNIVKLKVLVDVNQEYVESLDIVIETQRDMLAEFVKQQEISTAIKHLTSLPDRSELVIPDEADRSKDHYVFSPDGPPASFCRYCGASIPHRDGEGRCDKCMHHLPDHNATGKDHYPAPEPETTGETMYRNRYECPCGNVWWDSWSCIVDDDCPTCGTTCSPSDSTDLKVSIPEPPNTVYEEMRNIKKGETKFIDIDNGFTFYPNKEDDDLQSP